MEHIGSALKGIYRDVLVGADGQVIRDSGWVSNTILDTCRVLLAGFVGGEEADGIQSLAVGQGQAAWDTDGAPAADPGTTTGLESPFAPPIPVAELELDYLDETDSVVTGPTSRLQITATLDPGYPAPLSGGTTYPLREFGLFCLLGGEAEMINVIRHPVIHKDASTTLIRTVRLYF